LPPEPTTALEFEQLDIDLDELRSQARRSRDLELMATAVTETSDS